MKNNKIFWTTILLVLVINVNFSSAHGEETFAAAEDIIKQKIACDELNEDQLEILGDYYMEQMHPGESHEYMDEMMGGEGSESLRIAHINMGLAFYCGEHEAMSGGVMNMMMGRGMMGGSYSNLGMMGNTYYGNSRTGFGFFGWIIMVLVLSILILLILLLIKKIQKPRRRK